MTKYQHSKWSNPFSRIWAEFKKMQNKRISPCDAVLKPMALAVMCDLPRESVTQNMPHTSCAVLKSLSSFFLGHLSCKNTHVPPWTVPFQRAFSRTAPWLSRRWLCAWERFLDFFVEAQPLRPGGRDAGKRGTTCWKWKCLQKLLRNPELYYRGWKGRWVTTGINDGFLPLTTAGLLRCMHEAKEYFHRLLLSDHHGSGEVPCLWLLDGEFFTVLPEKGLQGFHPVLPTGR